LLGDAVNIASRLEQLNKQFGPAFSRRKARSAAAGALESCVAAGRRDVRATRMSSSSIA